MKPLYNMPEDNNLLFTTYHPHYKEKIVSNPTRTFVCIANCLYLYGLCNLSMASLFAQHGDACTAKPGLVNKKEKLHRTSLHLLFHAFQPSSFFFSLMFSEIRPAISKSVMSKPATMFK